MSTPYSIDALRLREGRCFGWGWVLDPAAPARAWTLRIPLDDGSVAAVHGLPGGNRPDLATAFPDVPHAAGAGFLVQGTVAGRPAPGQDAQLEVELRDGRRIDCTVPHALLADAGCDPAEHAARPFARLRAHLARHGMRATMVALALRAGSWLAFAWALRRGADLPVVFDHEMGGGANTFRDLLVSRLAARGPCLVISPVVHLLAYRATLHLHGRRHERVVPALQPLLDRLGGLRQLDLHVNEVVSFPDPLAVLDWCRRMRASSAAQLTFYLHDYHAVCPSWTLMDVDDRFCGVPALDACLRCLPANRVHTLGFAPPGLDLAHWRSGWSAFLASCDRVQAFSQASLDILRRVYGEVLDGARARVEPHEVAGGLRAARLAPPAVGEPVVVACAGHISVAKGARMLRDMASVARDEGLPLRFVVFGSLDGHDGGDGIDVLGGYDRAELPGLLEAHGVNLAFLPSVCAETFSFVTAEFMAMHVPVAVFPIGAPAERIAGYADGLVISRIDARAAVHELSGFATRLARARSTSPIHD